MSFEDIKQPFVELSSKLLDDILNLFYSNILKDGKNVNFAEIRKSPGLKEARNSSLFLFKLILLTVFFSFVFQRMNYIQLTSPN